MLGRHVYRVTAARRRVDGQQGRRGRPRGNFPSRDQAIAAAERLARSDRPARIMIDSDDGSIAEERLFGLEPSDQLQP
jgi:Uncharacterized protein conserved in bacteria (DUF2188)